MTNSQTIKQDGNKFYNMAKDFHLAFDHPVGEVPAPLSLERVTARGIWKAEEIVEGIHASGETVEDFNKAIDAFIKGVENARQKSLREKFPDNPIDRLVAQVDAFSDELYFNQGDFVELCIEPDKVFGIVHSANMSKLFTNEDGTKYAKYREEDGKILKSPEFFAPEAKLKEEVLRQIKEAESK